MEIEYVQKHKNLAYERADKIKNIADKLIFNQQQQSRLNELIVSIDCKMCSNDDSVLRYFKRNLGDGYLLEFVKKFAPKMIEEYEITIQNQIKQITP